MTLQEDKGEDSSKFIDSHLAEARQNVYFKGWAETIFTEKKVKPRLVVVSNFRVLLIKTAPLGGFSIRQSFPLLYLKSIRQSRVPNQLILTFDEDPAVKDFGFASSYSATAFGELTIQHPRISYIAQSILFSAVAIRFGREPLDIDIPEEWLSGYRAPEPDAQDGLIATYIAECDRVGIPPRIQVIDYFMTCFQLRDTLFDFNAALASVDNNTRDILAIVSALKHSSWFTGIMCVDFPLKNDGAMAFATMFEIPTSIRSLIIVNTKINKTGIGYIASALAKGQQAIDQLVICKNDIGDAGITMLCEGLEASRKVPSMLTLSSLNFSTKGFKSLARLLSIPEWAATVRMLDVSDNSMGKVGTDAITGWLAKDLVLEQLFMCRCDCDLEKLFSCLKVNSLITSSLNTIDVGENKLSKQAAPELCKILSTTTCLTTIGLSDCHIERKYILDILSAALLNKFPEINFSLDLSKNDIGPRGAKEIQTLLADRSANDPEPLMKNSVLYSLDFSENGLGNDGLAIICKALQGTSIKVLKLDRNFKTFLFTKGAECADALASFVSNTPSLTEFYITGDDSTYHMGKFLNEMLRALANHPNLNRLDIQKNRILDDGIRNLAESITTNKSITHLEIDEARFSLEGFQMIHKALRENRTVTNFVLPLNDIKRLISDHSRNAEKMSEIQSRIHEIDIFMDRNDALAKSNSTDAAPHDSSVGISNTGLTPADSNPANAPAPRKKGAVAKRLSVAGNTSYMEMMQLMKPTNTNRKNQTTLLDKDVSNVLRSQQPVHDSEESVSRSHNHSQSHNNYHSQPQTPGTPLPQPQSPLPPQPPQHQAPPMMSVAAASPTSSYQQQNLSSPSSQSYPQQATSQPGSPPPARAPQGPRKVNIHVSRGASASVPFATTPSNGGSSN